MGQHLSHLLAAATRTGGQGGGPKVRKGLILCSSSALLLLHYFIFLCITGLTPLPSCPRAVRSGGSFVLQIYHMMGL